MCLAKGVYTVWLRARGGEDFGKEGLNEQLLQKDNKSLALSFSAYLFGVAFITRAAIMDFGYAAPSSQAYFDGQDTEEGIDVRVENIYQGLAWMSIGLVLLLVSQLSNQLVLRIDQPKAGEKYLANGMVEACSFTASSLITAAAVSGQPTTWEEDIASTMIFFALGQGVFLVFGVVFQSLTKYDLWKEVHEGNPAAGVSFGLHLIALANLLSGAIFRSDSLPNFGMWVGISFVWLFLIRFLIDKLLLPGSALDEEIARDRNWGAAFITGGVQIAVTIVVNNLSQDPCVVGVPGKLADRLTAEEFSEDLWNWDRLAMLLYTFAIIVVGRIVYGLRIASLSKITAGELSYAPRDEEGKNLPEDWTSDARLNHVLLEKDNKAVCVSFAGYIFGLCVMLSGNAQNIKLEGNSAVGGVESLGMVALFAALGCLFVFLSGVLNDRILLHTESNLVELHKGNLAVGIFEACSYVATGYMVGASLAGSTYDSGTLGEDILGVVLFFVLGQLCIISHGKLVEVLTPYNVQEQIVTQQNAAAGLSGGLHVLALSLLAANAVAEAFTLPVYFIWVLVGSLLLIATEYAMDRLILPGEALNKEISADKNWGAALISGVISVGLAFLLNTFLRDCIYSVAAV